MIITGLIGSRGNGKEEINYREKKAHIEWVAKPLEHVFPSAPKHPWRAAVSEENSDMQYHISQINRKSRFII